MNVETTFSQQDSNLDAQFANNGESFSVSLAEATGAAPDIYILEGSMNAIVNGTVVVRLFKNGQPCTERVYLHSQVSSGGADFQDHGTSTGWLTTTKTWSFGGTENGMAWRLYAYADNTKSKLLAGCYIFGGPGGKGEKGDTGENGADGVNGTDGFSPTVSLSKAGSVTTISVTDKNGTQTTQIYDGGAPATDYPDADARARFIDAMEEKASKMGLNITINGPAGYPDNNYSDGKSMAKLYTVANGYHELSKIWNTSTKVLHTKDVVSTINLYSSVFYTDSSHFASDLTNHYFMHGGKTGTTGSSNRLLGCIMKAPDDRQFTAWLTTKAITESTGNNRHACMKLLMDIAYAKYKDPNADVSTIEAQMVEKGVTSAVVMLVPQTANLLNYERFNFFETEMTDGEVANATLDTVAWGGKTYREIFLDGNMFADVSAITEANNSGWAQYSSLAKPTPTTSQCNTSPNAWNCSGTKSVQMSKDLSLTNGNNFYIACKRRLASYTAGGWLGVEVYYIGGAGKVISDTINASSVSETFETVSHTFTPKTATTQFWIGSGGSANLTGYIDDVVCVNMTELFGTNVPSKEQMNTLYENFLKIYKGEPISGQVERYKYEYPVYEYQASNRVNIASNTKVLTAITALDYINNLDEWITIKAGDIQPGSGPVFQGGERMTMREALYALMLPSSNTCAYAIARVIGNKLLNLDEA